MDPQIEEVPEFEFDDGSSRGYSRFLSRKALCTRIYHTAIVKTLAMAGVHKLRPLQDETGQVQSGMWSGCRELETTRPL